MKKTTDLAAALTRAAGGTTSTRPAPTAAADRKVLLVRLDPDTMRRLKHLAVDPGQHAASAGRGSDRPTVRAVRGLIRAGRSA